MEFLLLKNFRNTSICVFLNSLNSLFDKKKIIIKCLQVIVR